jgi:hypothetical protein
VRICHRQRGDEVDMGVRVRFVFVEPQMDHVGAVGQQLRSRLGRGRDSRLERDRCHDVAAAAMIRQGTRSPYLWSRSRDLIAQSYLIVRPTEFSQASIISDPNARLLPIVYSLASSCEETHISTSL